MMMEKFSSALSSIGYFEKKPTVAVAVSGGADSMALLLLADAWAKNKRGKVIALTVDHGLRKESNAEAKQVAAWCKTLGIEHHVLTWDHSIPPTAGGGSNQAAARDARYTLLTGWCKKNKILHLFTAHHQNDQAETLLFRLARGSFIEGLASIPAVSTRDGVRLLRPLLATPKSALMDFLTEKKQEWIEDPSNQSPKYTRNVIRNYISDDAAEKAGKLASRFAVIRNRLEHALAKAMVQTVDIFPDGHAALHASPFRKLPAEQAMRLLSALVQTVGGEPMQPRTEKLRRLYQDLTKTNPPRKRSLGGCCFHHQPKNNGWRVEYDVTAPHIRIRRAAAGKTVVRPAKSLAGWAFLGLNRSI